MKIIRVLLCIIGLVSLTACNVQQPSQLNNNSLAAIDNMQLGLAYLEQGDRTRAKYKLLLALQQDPNSARIQDAMAYFLEMTGNITQAEFYYQRAIQIAPASGAEHNNYGVFLCHQGEFEKSEQQFLAAVTDPNYLNTAKAYENAGLCAQQIPDLKKAELFYTQAIKQDPQLAMAWYELAQISFDKGDKQQAQQDIENYMKLVRNKDT